MQCKQHLGQCSVVTLTTDKMCYGSGNSRWGFIKTFGTFLQRIYHYNLLQSTFTREKLKLKVCLITLKYYFWTNYFMKIQKKKTSQWWEIWRDICGTAHQNPSRAKRTLYCYDMASFYGKTSLKVFLNELRNL